MNADQDIAMDFKSAMRRMATTVCIITCAGKLGGHGMTATAVTSVCADPSALLVCVNSNAAFYQAMIHADKFCVNLLDSSQAELSRAFSGQLQGHERFTVGQWKTRCDDLPYLVDAQANLFCLKDEVIRYGTHSIFIGRVQEVHNAPNISPLLYQDGHYAHAQYLSAA